jgi:hypothetical protein
VEAVAAQDYAPAPPPLLPPASPGLATAAAGRRVPPVGHRLLAEPQVRPRRLLRPRGSRSRPSSVSGGVGGGTRGAVGARRG